MFDVAYSTDTVRIPDQIVSGNESSDSPVEFDIAPAWGADLARLRSVIEASEGMLTDDWSPERQASVSAGFTDGPKAFNNTILAIRNLWIPAAMAHRAGLIGTAAPGAGKVPITTGEQFARICGAPDLLGMALFVAYRIINLNRKQQVDARFFAQPSGGGGTVSGHPTTTTAGAAKTGSRRRATAGSETEPDGQGPGMSRPKS